MSRSKAANLRLTKKLLETKVNREARAAAAKAMLKGK